MDKKKKKIILILIGLILVIAVAGGAAAWFFFGSKGSDDFSGRDMAGGNRGAMMAGAMPEDVVTASGSTSVGMQEETFELDYIETELIVEEVYLSSQDEVQAGTAILKLTDESIQEARRELEEKAVQADLDYRQAVLDAEEDRITADQTLKTSQTKGSYASYTMEESLQRYQDEIDKLTEQITEAQELVDEYTASLETDYYYTYYEVAEKEQALNETFQALMALYEEWDVPTLRDHNTSSSQGGSSMGGTMGGSMGGGMGGGRGGVSNDSTKLTVYDMLDEEVQENQKEYEQAKEDYEAAKLNAVNSFNQAVSNLQLLQLELEEAQIEYDKQKVNSQSEYEAAVSTGSNAQTTWEREIERIEEELKLALNEKEDADDNLADFEATIGDGCLYTQNAGTVMMVMAREENALTGGGMVLAYSNPDSVTVNASVAQEDIAKVEVGEKAMVIFSEYGTFDGVVKSVNPVSTSSGRSSVTYSVTISLSGDVSVLSQNLSATVYIGVSSEDMQQAMPQGENGERPEGGMPEGEMPDMGEGAEG